MFRTIAATLVALAVSAGCIALPEDAAQEAQPATAPSEEDRVDGMTAEASHADADVSCSDGGGIQIPPVFCAERILVATGRIGVDALPVDLIGSNGAIEIRATSGDDWSFTATVRVSALTQQLARDALDTAWTWTHEDADGTHALRAGPAPTASLGGLMGSVRSSTYTVTLPEWVVVDLRALTDNGAIVAEGLAMRDVDVETDNGQIVLTGSVQDLRARTDNGEVVAVLRPVASGSLDLATDNGQIVLKVPEGRAFGYDVAGKTDNGQVVIGLRDGDVRTTEDGATFRTSSFDARSIQTTIALETDNGQAVVAPSS